MQLLYRILITLTLFYCYISYSYAKSLSDTEIQFSSIQVEDTIFITGKGGQIRKKVGDSPEIEVFRGTGSNLHSIVYADHRYIAVGDGGLIVTSMDGDHWLFGFVSKSPTDALNTITWNGTLFITAGDNGHIFTSKDGNNWEPLKSFTQHNIYGSFFDGKTTYLVGEQGTILVSSDGLNWQKFNTTTANTLYAIYTTPELMIAVGVQGMILISHDNGDSWKVVETSLDAKQDLLYVNKIDKHIYITGTQGAFASSSDNGEHYFVIKPNGLPGSITDTIYNYQYNENSHDYYYLDHHGNITVARSTVTVKFKIGTAFEGAICSTAHGCDVWNQGGTWDFVGTERVLDLMKQDQSICIIAWGGANSYYLHRWHLTQPYPAATEIGITGMAHATSVSFNPDLMAHDANGICIIDYDPTNPNNPAHSFLKECT